MSYRRGGYSRYHGTRYSHSSGDYHRGSTGFHSYGCSLYRASGGGPLGFVVLAILAIAATPVFGGYYLIHGKNDTQKVLGGVALIGGIVLWIVLGLVYD